MWAEYEPAVRQWEELSGRPAPEPRSIGPRGGVIANPGFVEWMQGLPEGWVAGVVPDKKALKTLGNGVVPQQAAMAISVLWPELDRMLQASS